MANILKIQRSEAGKGYGYVADGKFHAEEDAWAIPGAIFVLPRSNEEGEVIALVKECYDEDEEGQETFAGYEKVADVV